ncbi:MAG: 4Fe-4S dicluster domain-containing protein [bacterium]
MISRKEFFTKSFKAAFGAAAKVLDARLPAEIKELPRQIYPPGAAKDFTEKCAACGDCAASCPVDAIQIKKDAVSGQNVAMIVPRDQPCIMCEELPCTHTCNQQALLPPAGNAFPKIGLAVFREDVCLAYTGSYCMTCYDACPLKRRAMLLEFNRPVIDASTCTGCGVCEQVCILSSENGVVIEPV